jgi:hypothetical protein
MLNPKILLQTIALSQKKMNCKTHTLNSSKNLLRLSLNTLVLVIIVLINRMSGQW